MDKMGSPSVPRVRTIAPKTVVLPSDDIVKRAAIRRKLRHGLPKIRRPSNQNQINLIIPISFLSVTAPTLEIESGLQPERNKSCPSTENQLADSDQLFQGRPDPIAMLGAGRVDPFANYPIVVNRVDQYILDQVFTSHDPALRTFRLVWLPIALNDEGTFHQLLASCASRIRRVRGQSGDNVTSMKHHGLAIHSVNGKLFELDQKTSVEAIACVTSLTCYSVITENFTSFDAHMKGLGQLVEFGGGFDRIAEVNPILRSILFSVDMSGACRLDSIPRFPLPERFLCQQKESMLPCLRPETESLVQVSTHFWKTVIAGDDLLSQVFTDTFHALRYVYHKILQNESWLSFEFITLYIDPISHKLLSSQTVVDPSDQSSIVREAVRLGILLFFGEIRRKSGALSVFTIVQMRKLKTLLFDGVLNELAETHRWVHMWLVFFGCVESWGFPEFRFFVACLAKSARSNGVSVWSEVVVNIKAVLWWVDVHDERAEFVKEAFDMAMRQHAGQKSSREE